ncbi:hypothetical protein A1Q2_04646 [Trichosporon asahii var. asahii CBS 8904]|uniref:F-box domain-containing protein n=1 Tax=Trichosporon asahii var. asahii (strain CBS 8904) TaxID=1220162 RepID=K1VWI7_TRIAC|nr:hypothetical protein A1Q2_04646 [Trichosporon asahii var. asahii CBS 8904]
MLSFLPSEVLLIIADFLAPSDLASLVRVNSLFHATFVQPLYASVEAVRHGAPNFYPPLSSTAYARHIRSLTVRPHLKEVCASSSFPEHDILHLRQVRLHLIPPITNPEFLLHTLIPPDLSLVTEPSCGFLAHVRAERLVIMETYMDAGCLGYLVPWLDDIEDVVLFFPPVQTLTAFGGVEPRKEAATDLVQIMAHVPMAVRRMTVVVQHPVPSLRSTLPPIEEYARHLLKSPQELVRGVVDVLQDLRKLPPATEGGLGCLTIVLPEGVLSQECREYLLQTIRPQSGSARILGMLEFMARPEYQGVMTDEQLRIWWERSRLPHYEMTVKEVKECIH